MMKKMILLTVLVASLGMAKAQSEYKQAIGARVSGALGYDVFSGSFKTFMSDAGAMEFNVGFGFNTYGYLLGSYKTTTLGLSAAYQHHFPIGNVEGLKWYLGGGATALYSSSKWDDYKGFSLGVFPTGGVDYKFKNIPLNVSADWRPTFFFVNPDKGLFHGFYPSSAGVAARYTF